MAGGVRFGDDDEAPITEINVTPLVDVMLVLLVIFMVTARIIATKGVDVSRPKSTAGAPIEGPPPIVLSVDSAGALYVNGQVAATPAAATETVMQLAGGKPDAKVIIDGDEAVAYAAVMTAIEVASEAGITRIALANAPKAPTTP